MNNEKLLIDIFADWCRKNNFKGQSYSEKLDNYVFHGPLQTKLFVERNNNFFMVKVTRIVLCVNNYTVTSEFMNLKDKSKIQDTIDKFIKMN